MKKILSEKILARSPIESGYLPNTDQFTSITAKAAYLLSKQKITDLDLSGITTINDSVAKSLSTINGDLDLSGLKRLSTRSANSLAKHVGWLKLSNLKTLSSDAFKYLGQHQGGICLNGLTVLSDSDAKELSNSKGGLSLNSIHHLSDTAIEALAKHNGFICFGLKSLSDLGASSLTHHEGGGLIFEGLTDISLAAIHSLTKHADFVELDETATYITTCFSDFKHFQTTRDTSRFKDCISIIKEYLHHWNELGVSENIELEFSGSGGEGSISVFMISRTGGRVLEANGYAFKWLEHGLEHLDFLKPHKSTAGLKNGLLGLVSGLLPLGWEINGGTRGEIVLNTTSNKVIISFSRCYDELNLACNYHEWTEEF